MSNFGLGIILSFTDKASAGINGAVISLNGLNNAVDGSSDKLSTIGKSFSALTSLGAGMTAAITAPIAGFVGKITSYGMARASFVEDTHLAFTSLMSDAQKASDYMQEMMDFAKTTPYAYEGIVSAAQGLISSGVKDVDILNKKADGTFSGILQAIGDAAGATGSGMAGFQSMANALSNIKAEGKASGIRIQQLQRYGIQASKIIGNMYNIKEPEALEKIKSMSADQFIADLTKGIEEGTKGLNGATGKMAGQMENLKGTFTGAKDTFTSSLKTAGLELMGGYEDEFGVMRYKFEQNMSKSLVRMAESIKNIAPLFQPIVTFVEKVAVYGSKAIKGFTTAFSKLNPTVKGLLGMTTTFLALAGPGMLFLGKVLGPAIDGMISLKRELHLTNLPLKNFALGAGLAYLAWKTDFMGMRSLVTSFTTNLKDSFNNAREIANGDVNSLTSSIANLRAKGDFWSNMTIGFTKLHVIGTALAELFSSEDGLTMSVETWEKARVAGVLPFIEGILDLKYRFDNFKEGFIAGWQSVSNAVKNAFTSMNKAVEGTFLESAIDNLGKFFKMITNNDPDAWKKFGEVAGKMAPVLLAVSFAMRTLNKFASPLSKVTSLIPPIFNKKDSAGGSGGGLKGVTSSILGNPKSVLKSMGSIAIIIGGTALIMTALGVVSMNPYFDMFISRGAEVLSKLFTGLLPMASIAGVLGALTYGFGKIGNPTAFAKGIGNLAILLGGMQLLVTAMGALNSIPHFSEFLNEGGRVLDTLGGALKNIVSPTFLGAIALTAGLGFIPVPNVLQGIANLALICGGLTALISAFGALNKIPGINDFINSGGDLLANVFKQIGKVVGSIVGGIGEGVTNSLPVMGDNLAQFGENIKPFLQAFKGVDASGIASFAGAFGKMMLTLTGNNILEFVGGKVDLAEVGNQLAQFGTSIQPFLDSMATVDDTSISKGTNVLKMLSNMSGYQLKTGGLLQGITGNVNLANAGTQLNAFATNVKPFLDSAATIPEGATENANNVLRLLGAMSGYSLKTGGLLQGITGDVDLGNAGSQLTKFATNVSPFLAIASSVDASAITNGQNMLKVLDVIQSKGGDATTLNIASAGTQLSNFATNARTFFTTATAIGDFSAGERMIQASSKASALNALASSGGSNLASYGMGLVRFATSWRTFVSQFRGTADTSGVTKMGTALQQFAQRLSSTNSQVNSQMSSMLSTIRSKISSMKSAFSSAKFSFPHTDIAVPHFSSSGKFDAKTGQVPSFSFDGWWETGGVFDRPSIIGVGENGREAVMPLEKNTGWINELANKIGILINAGANTIPTAFSYLANKMQEVGNTSTVVGSPVSDSADSVPNIISVPVSSGNSQTVKNSRGNTNIDNSVTFQSGAIVVNVRNASEEEAERLANSIMDKISWKQKLEAMRNFADLGNETPVFDI